MSNVQSTTTRYECQKCFSTFFSRTLVRKHLMTHNIEIPDGVFPDNLVQKVTSCVKCKKQIESRRHVCEYVCAACLNVFKTMGLYDEHVRKWHDEGLETLFFPNIGEFNKWKLDLELQTESKFAVKDKYSGKCYHHCSMNSKGNLSNFLCPSTIIAQEFENGVQVYFYKNHFRHEYSDYLLYERYKKWHTTTIMQTHNDDMYLQLKGLLENIIIESARLNGQALNVLMGQALEMTLILTNYDDDNDISINPEKFNTSEKTIPQKVSSVKISKDILDVENKDEPNSKQKLDCSHNFATPDEGLVKQKCLKTYSRKRGACEMIDLTKTLSKNDDSKTHEADDLYSIRKTNDSDPLSTPCNPVILQKYSENSDSFNNRFTSFVDKYYNVSTKKTRTENDSYLLRKICLNSMNENTSSSPNQKNSISDHNRISLDHSKNSFSNQNEKSESTAKKYHFYIDENGTITTTPNSNTDSNETNYISDKIKSNYSLDRKPEQQRQLFIDTNQISRISVPKVKNNNNDKVGDHIQTEINNSLEHYMKIHCKLEDKKTSQNDTKPVIKPNAKSKPNVTYERVRCVNDKTSGKDMFAATTRDTTQKIPLLKSDNIKKEKPDNAISKRIMYNEPFSIKSSPKISVRRFALEKPKVDLEYEVKEQETDCNILVLKI